MNMTLRLLLTALFILVSSQSFNSKAFAQAPCQPIYGGGQTCIVSPNILVDKKIFNPKTGSMVDNLGINDPKYQPGSITTFQISVTNSSNKTISKIDVKDIFPQYVAFSSGPGAFDTNTKTLSFSIENLKSDESKTFTIMGRVVNTDQISVTQGSVVCIVNQANATSDNNGFSQDNSQFCIEKVSLQPSPSVKGGFPILSPPPVITTPPTGPASFQLAGLAITGILGYFLIKKSQTL